MSNHLRLATFVTLLIASSSIFAETVTLGDLLDLEAKVTLKKMNEELNKVTPLPGAGLPQQTRVMPLTMKSSSPMPDRPQPNVSQVKKNMPITTAVYGISSGSDTQYRGILNWADESHSVKVGSVVHGYTVKSITSKGISMSKKSKWKKQDSMIFSQLDVDSGQAVVSQPSPIQILKSE